MRARARVMTAGRPVNRRYALKQRGVPSLFWLKRTAVTREYQNCIINCEVGGVAPVSLGGSARMRRQLRRLVSW